MNNVLADRLNISQLTAGLIIFFICFIYLAWPHAQMTLGTIFRDVTTHCPAVILQLLLSPKGKRNLYAFSQDAMESTSLTSLRQKRNRLVSYG